VNLEPGVVHDGGADTGLPIAIVTSSAERAAAYLDAASIGAYVIVHEHRHLPHGVRLGGLAMLDRKSVPEELAKALVKACFTGGDPQRPGGA
jgi:hypothetical protein